MTCKTRCKNILPSKKSKEILRLMMQEEKNPFFTAASFNHPFTSRNTETNSQDKKAFETKQILL